MLRKEDVYINLQGKSKEELTKLYWLLNTSGEKIKHGELSIFITEHYNKNHFLTYYQNKWQWGLLFGKQEVTIQQLKEILQPIDNTKFKKGDTIIITDFGSANSCYFTLNKPYVLAKDFNKDNGFYVEKDDNNHINNGWFNAFDLGIKIELYEELSLTEQLEKAKAEVERLEKSIEESKIKVGDWVISNNTNVFKYKRWMVKSEKWVKITDQELINKLNELIK